MVDRLYVEPRRLCEIGLRDTALTAAKPDSLTHCFLRFLVQRAHRWSAFPTWLVFWHDWELIPDGPPLSRGLFSVVLHPGIHCNSSDQSHNNASLPAEPGRLELFELGNLGLVEIGLPNQIGDELVG